MKRLIAAGVHFLILRSVAVGSGVLLGRGVSETTGAGVQVGGRRTDVGVGVGILMVGINVGGGNGLMEETGLLKMANTTLISTTAPINTSTERISHTLIFIVFPPQFQNKNERPLL
jgi:hypothetical protein